MNDRRAVVAIVGSALGLITVILVVVFVAIIPLPEFDELRPGVAPGRIAYVGSSDECVVVADLQLGTRNELSCEYRFPEQLAWSRDGIEIQVFDGPSGATVVTLDPETGDELSHEALAPDEFPRPPEPDPSTVRGGRDGRSSILGPDGAVVLTLEGPETYHVNAVLTGPDEMWIAFVDSSDRLATFEIGTDTVYLVAEDVRGFPSPVWEP